MIFFLAAILLSAQPTASAPTPAPAVDRDCRDDRMIDRCAEADQRRMGALYGLRPIEEHRDAGDRVRRVFYVDGYGRDVVAIAFVRAAGRDPAVFVHFPRRAGEAAPAPFEAPVTQAVWDDLIFRSALFDRALIPVPTPDNVIPICMHSWLYAVEASDPARSQYERATIRRATHNSCGPSLAQAFAIEAQRAALPLFPACNRLDPEQHRNPASQLAACRLLSGDRVAAAEILNLAGPFRRVSTREEAGLIYGRFAYDATVDWNGARNTGDGSAMAFWIERVLAEGRPSLFFESVEGISADEVRLKAFFSAHRPRFGGPAGAPSAPRSCRSGSASKVSFGSLSALLSVPGKRSRDADPTCFKETNKGPHPPLPAPRAASGERRASRG